ncbi:MAG TPA: hypothetical protein VFZ02_10420 [Ktedonobacteraceae bacterium]
MLNLLRSLQRQFHHSPRELLNRQVLQGTNRSSGFACQIAQHVARQKEEYGMTSLIPPIDYESHHIHPHYYFIIEEEMVQRT